MTNPIHNGLKLTICQSVEDAVSQGFDYAKQPEKYGPAQIENVVLVRNGTQSGKSTVDLIFKTADGKLHVALLTAALLKSIPA